MRKQIANILFLLLPLCVVAQEQQSVSTTSASAPAKTQNNKIFTGFSGGMMLHLGYAFSQSPDALFRNASLLDYDKLSSLPRSGVTMGIGGALRVHLLNHIHIGSEGFMSSMPLMKTGSHVRMGYGGVLCDYYWTWGKVSPLIGMTVGGGSMSRLYVPYDKENIESTATETTYNASYTKTPFFMLDPYIGLEIELTRRIALLLRLDWVLPFGGNGSQLSKDVSWSHYVSPSGPRLYVGFMFGHLHQK